MVNVFETVISQMLELGFYNLIIFVLALAIFYAVLKRAKIFGESPVVIGIISFAISFLVFGYPVIIGFSLVTPLVSMFTQTTVFLMVFVVAFLIASFFYPDLPNFLVSNFKSRSMISTAIAIGVAIAILSGAASVLWTTPKSNIGMPGAPTQLVIMAFTVVVMIILLIVASAVVVSKS